MKRQDEQREKSQKALIKDAYGKMAEEDGSSCCGSGSAEGRARSVGYSSEEIEGLPEGAFLGLSCGNPIEEAGLKEGEVVVDLGSGGGHDALLAARRVGPQGKVIGVDMTPSMIERARGLAETEGIGALEFRLGEIEDLPVDDDTVDAVISNCVINLSQDKSRVFREVYRVLKPGGRMIVSDIVLTGEIPEALKESVEGLIACLANASTLEEYLEDVRSAGLELDLVDAQGLPSVLKPETTDPLIRAVYESLPNAESMVGLAQSVKILASKPA